MTEPIDPISAVSDPARLALPVLLLGASAIAFAPIFVRLSELDPVTTAFYRVFLSLPAMWIWTVIPAGSARPARAPAGLRDYARLALAGVFFAGDLAFWHWSIALTSVANATLLANFAPVFVALGGFVLFRERFTRLFLIGMALALAGAVILMSDSLTLDPRYIQGDGLGIVTAMFYGAYILSVGRLRTDFSTGRIMIWSSATAAVVLLPVSLAFGDGMLAASAYGWAVLAGLALLSHAGGQGMIAFALAHLPAAFTSVGLLLQPVVAALLAWLILAEPVGPIQTAGAIVILAGIFFAHRGRIPRPPG
jgi:drug/metabolite transporter (DMT)-like permease